MQPIHVGVDTVSIPLCRSTYLNWPCNKSCIKLSVYLQKVFMFCVIGVTYTHTHTHLKIWICCSNLQLSSLFECQLKHKGTNFVCWLVKEFRQRQTSNTSLEPSTHVSSQTHTKGLARRTWKPLELSSTVLYRQRFIGCPALIARN